MSWSAMQRCCARGSRCRCCRCCRRSPRRKVTAGGRPRLGGKLRRRDERYRDDGEPRRGRRRKELTQEQQRAIADLQQKHPSIGLPKLLQEIPGLPKKSAAAYLKRLKRVRKRRCQRRRCIVHWHVPGSVWAIDGTMFDLPIDTNGRRALVVADLYSHKTLAVESVPGERAKAVIRLLQRLVEQHGAPLVLKADNGSAFIAKCLARFCRRHAITLMHSPVRRPSWNGTCEVSGRWAKRRALAAARLRGATDRLCQADLDCAVTFTGVMPCVDAALRQRFLRCYEEQLAAVVAEQGLALGDDLKDHVRRSLGRVAARRALQLCHILTIEGREYRQCFPASAA